MMRIQVGRLAGFANRDDSLNLSRTGQNRGNEGREGASGRATIDEPVNKLQNSLQRRNLTKKLGYKFRTITEINRVYAMIRYDTLHSESESDAGVG